MTKWGVEKRLAYGRPWVGGGFLQKTRKNARACAALLRKHVGFGNTRVVKVWVAKEKT